MAAVIRFKTRMFDITKERPNPINPIPGESLLLWLAEKTRGKLSMSQPGAEDWGWYCYVDWNGRSYMLGSCAYEEEDQGGPNEWLLQIEKQRSLIERLRGREKLGPDDQCVEFFRKLLKSEPEFSEVSVDEIR